MTKDVLVRGVDEEIYTSLGNAAKERGISMNSLVKDAIDSWLSRKNDQIKTHHLVLYSDEKSIESLLKSLDYFAKKNEWFRCHFGPSTEQGVMLLDEMKWFNGTILPYSLDVKGIQNYCGNTIQKIIDEAKKQPVCCVDFILGDIANQKSLSNAIKIEHEYNKIRVNGLMFCPYKTSDLLTAGIEDLIELFEEHDQIFILKEEKVYKIHLTLESVHKMIMK